MLVDTARMALPVQVRCTNQCSPSMSPMATAKIVTLTLVTITPPSSKRTSLRMAGYGRGLGVNANIAAFCKNKLTPMAVMSGVSRCAPRTGR
jgi:hypothetical protein